MSRAMTVARAGAISFAVMPIALPACATPSGGVVFETHCQVCHQAGGVGVAGQFPRVAGRAGVIAATPEGRQFLSALVLNGMSGTVKVDGQKIIGVMPAFDSLTDAEAASVLTYISTLGAGKANVAPFRAAEIATARTLGKETPTDMVKRRNQLAADKIIP